MVVKTGLFGSESCGGRILPAKAGTPNLCRDSAGMSRLYAASNRISNLEFCANGLARVFHFCYVAAVFRDCDMIKVVCEQVKGVAHF
jgi:hypothetical protein